MRKNSGGAAEEAAVLFLEGKGIRILERNFRSYHGEIDIIALEQEMILVNYYRMQRRLAENTAVRFDVIEVDKDFRCHWIQNAFEFQG